MNSYEKQQKAQKEAEDIVNEERFLALVSDFNGEAEGMLMDFVQSITPYCSALELENILKIKSNLTSKFLEKSNKIEDRLATRAADLVSDAQREIQIRLIDLEHQNERIEDLESEVEKLKDKKDDLERQIDELKEEIRSL